jgi:DNA topoisomerase IB
MPLDRAAATAVRLLDLGYFRIGADAYAEDNGSFGLTTLERHHVRRRGAVLVFHFVGKSGIEHTVEIDDPAAIEALDQMRRRRTESQRLLAYQSSRAWSDLDAADVNAYLGALVGGELTAKDFRTWHATVLAALALSASDEPGDTKASRRRAVKAAIEEVAGYLGNSPTIARNSYIDPRVLDLYELGTTIEVDASKYRSPERRQAAVEKALLDLLHAD